MRVYLSGAITGNPAAAEQFKQKQHELETLGFEVFNPMSLGEGLTYREYMKKDLQELLQSDRICYVNDTSSSCGVLAEKTVAHVCGIRELSALDLAKRGDIDLWR